MREEETKGRHKRKYEIQMKKKNYDEKGRRKK